MYSPVLFTVRPDLGSLKGMVVVVAVVAVVVRAPSAVEILLPRLLAAELRLHSRSVYAIGVAISGTRLRAYHCLLLRDA
jgi:hypothetical protein